MYPRDDDPSYGIFVAEQLRALREAGVAADLYFIEGYRGRLAYARAIGALRKKRRDYDLFHAHHAYAGAAARLAGVRPLVITIHEGAVTKNPAYRCFARAVATGAARCVAVSPAIARALAPTPSTVIPIGVDLGVFRPQDRFACRHVLGLRADKVYALFPTSPARPEKRYPLAAEAVAVAQRSVPNLELLVLPPSARGTVATYFGAADLALITSDFESGPMTVKEAVASGRPVVSRRVGDVEFLEKCPACLVVGDDPASIADGIVRALGLKADAGAAVLEYELGAVTRRLVDLYRETAGAGR